MLEDKVDEKYYISEKQILGMIKTNFNQYSLEHSLIERERERATPLLQDTKELHK